MALTQGFAEVTMGRAGKRPDVPVGRVFVEIETEPASTCGPRFGDAVGWVDQWASEWLLNIDPYEQWRMIKFLDKFLAKRRERNKRKRDRRARR